MGAQVSRQNVGTHSTQNSVSNGSSLNYFNINYFKDAASSGASKLEFSQDPSKFTDPVKDVLEKGIPTLQSPTVEACGYSDRIIQITRGDSTITSQDVANAVVGYGVWPHYLTPQDATAIDKPTRPDTSSNRFYTLESQLWTAESKGWWWKLPDALKDMGIFGENMFYHFLGRSGYTVHVQCNASKFHQGTLLIAMIPEHQLATAAGGSVSAGYKYTHPGEKGRDVGKTGRERNDRQPSDDNWLNFDGTLLGNLTIFPHQFINLRSNNSATIIVPYVNAVPMDSMLRHNNWSLVIIPICELKCNNTAVTVPITISISPMCAEFSGARARNVTQGLPTLLTPGSGQFLTTDDFQSPSALPWYHPTKEISIPGQVRNLIELCQVDTMIPINNTNDTIRDKSMYTIRLGGVTNAKEAIFAMRVDIASQPLATTMIGEISSYYTHWTGSLRFSFMFCGSAFTTLKLLIAYTPPGITVPENRKKAMLGTHVIWDVGLQSTVSMVVPWVSASHYRNTTPDTYSAAGYITCWYQTDLITPPNTAPVADMICFVSGCKDFCLRMARDTNLHKQSGVIAQNPVERYVDEVLNEVLVVPNISESKPTTSNSAPALDAAETGHTSSVQPEDMVETRYVQTSQTRDEMSVESFLGRSGCIYMHTMNIDYDAYDDSVNNFVKWKISLQEMAQVRRKFELFTYVRFDSEITIVPCIAGQGGDVGHVVMQYMYVPPGAPLPTKRNDYTWQSGTNASVFWQHGQIYPRFSLPFLSIASAYYMFYDGYNGDSTDARYGTTVTNDMGTLCFRIVTEEHTNKVKVTTRIYHKAKHIKAWCPRPPRAVEYTNVHVTNYKPKTGDVAVSIVPRTNVREIRNFGPSDMYVHVGNLIYRNLHLFNSEMHDSILVSYSSDLVIYRTNTIGDDYIPACDCTQATYYCKHKNRYYPINVTSHDWYEIQESEYYPKHIQYNLLIGEGPCEPGDCGGKLLCKHGVIGIITAGGEGHVAFIDLRHFLCAEEQGVTDYIHMLGEAFGNGFVDSVKEHVNAINPINNISKKVIKWLLRIVSAMVIIIRNSSDPHTVVATLTLIGCSGSPWRFLKEKFCKWTQLNYIHKESDSWLKKFTEMCNAARGLEWIGNKISKFIEWMKSMLPQAQLKVKYLNELKKLNLLEKQVENLRCADTKTQEKIKVEVDTLHDLSCKFLPLYASEAKRIKVIYNKCSNIIKQRKRSEPVAVMIHGSPGTGKSITTSFLARMITNESDIYSLPPDPKYFDGYDQQSVVIMDDIMQNPDGEDMSLFCQMVSSVTFIPPMADLPDKGKPFDSRFVLCSTNHSLLAPPTITSLQAMNRRFFLDLDIVVHDNYKDAQGKLDVSKAFKPCDIDTKIGNARCCPFICGKAVTFKDRNTCQSYPLSQIYNLILQEDKRRTHVVDVMTAIFQGPISMEAPPPPAIADLLRSVKTPEVIKYCEDNKWIIPADCRIERDLNLANNIITIIANIISIAGIIYIIYKLFCSFQGPYSGEPKPKTKIPERRVVAQGPEEEFGRSIIKHNTCVVTTDNGKFTGLGIYDKLMVLPTHADPGKEVCINGITTKVSDSYDLYNKQGVKLEITAIVLDRNEKFRDIRKYIPEREDDYPDCNLALVANQPEPTIINVGDVISYGNILLSGNQTARMLKYNYPTKSGYCGGVLYKIGQIIGIHVGGNGRDGFSAMLLRSYFNQTQGEITVAKKVAECGLPTIHTPSKTKLQPSVFFDVFEGSKEPAVLTDKDPRLTTDFNKALFSKYKGNIECSMTDHMRVAISHYSAQLMTLDIDSVNISLEESVFGTEGLEALDLNTSAGFPYISMGIKKRDLINNTTKDITKLKLALDKYGVDLPMVTFLKDELRKKEKISTGKTRVIEASSVNDTIAFRVVYGNLFSSFHKNPGVVTGSAVGCDPETFWSKIPVMLDGDCIMAFDYTNYDGSIHPIWFEALKQVLRNLSFEDKLIDRLCKSKHIFRDTYYEVEGGVPSGCSGTSIFNTMINNIIIRTLVLDAYKHIDLDKLKIIAYGDDVIFSYKYPLDMEAIATEGNKYGLTITPADKSDTFKKLDYDNVTFLKRGFKQDAKYPFLIHPTFPVSEIHESIRWTKKPSQMQEHVLSLCHLMWHNGRDVYNEFERKIRSVSAGRALYIPPYELLLHEWYEKF
ncbi:polyprotein [rhinovirus A13]|uniref:Genome polyprotein n=36 Tax=Rhinovirus A TaxID=147711 RepID=B9V438_9ENTO|nr:polyprotein [rhinovirus A13]